MVIWCLSQGSAAALNHYALSSEHAAFRQDTIAWLNHLGKPKADIAVDMAMSEDTATLAEKYKRILGTISQMRRELHTDYVKFHSDERSR